MADSFDLVIVGGGLAGLGLAVALRDSHLRIALVESTVPRFPAADAWDARVYAISPINARFLADIGIWRHLEAERLTAVQDMRIFGDDGATLHFSAYQAGLPELAWIAECSLLLRELWETARRQANVTLLCPAHPQQLTVGEEAASLTLSDGTRLASKLIVAADGRDSWVRDQAGLATMSTPYEEKGVVANFACEIPHRGIAYQWFRRDGVLAWLPLPGKRISMVWSAADTLADDLFKHEQGSLAERVAAAGHHALGKFEQITVPAAFPLRLVRVPRTIAARIALIGDAAHGIHPLSGHGINLGFQDASVLADVLKQARDFEDIGQLPMLRRYERARKEEVVATQSLTDALRRLFKSDLALAGAIRNRGMNLTDHLPVVKSLLVRYAIGT